MWRRVELKAFALVPLAAAIVMLGLLFPREEPALPRVRNDAAEATAQALLVHACQVLEAGRWDEAQQAISQLGTLVPGRPEPLLLQKLLEKRRGLLAPGWGNAFLEAWAELGRPDLSGSPLLPPAPSAQADASMLIDQAWRHASAEERVPLVLAALSVSEEQTRWLVRYAATLEDTALLVALLDPRRQPLYPEALRAEVQAVLLQRLKHLTQDSADTMVPHLAALLSGSDGEAPFDAREMEALEAIATLERWRESSFFQTFSQSRQQLLEAGVPEAATRAFGVAEQTVGIGVALMLRKRAERSWAGLSWDEQRRLGRVLWRVGQRMAGASSLLEHSVGTLLMELGAEHMEQTCDQSQALAQDETVREGLRASLKVNIERWPLPSLWEDLETSRARDELRWLRAFTGHADLP
jgi:hypothetical protein